MFVVFAVFVMVFLLISITGSANDGDELDDFYIGPPRTSSLFAGLAVFGAYLSAASLLGNPGIIAISGYDGIVYALGPAVAWVVVLLAVAEPYRRVSRYTIGDFLSFRLRSRHLNMASAVTTLVISVLYLTGQLVGAGVLVTPIFGFHGENGQRVVVAGLGATMILFVAMGGMRVTTLVQSLKAVIVLSGALYLCVSVISHFHWSLSTLLEEAARNSGFGNRYVESGILFSNTVSKIDLISLQLSFALGAAGLPHLLMRISTTSSGRQARQAVQWAGLLYAIFCLAAIVLGLGSAALVTSEVIKGDANSGNTAILLLTERIGGPALLTFVCCMIFATIVTMVAGITLTAASSLAHDLYGAVWKKGKVSPRRELAAARIAVGLVGMGAICLSLYAQHLNVSLLVSLAFAIAASSVLPAVLYNIWWRGFSTRGALWCMYGGLVVSVLLTIFSPAVSGEHSALLPDQSFDYFPLKNPGLVSIPTGFFLGWLGSVGSRNSSDLYRRAEPHMLAGVPARAD